tara:strand:- start:888 stop:1220 length:333 start_codon:yes stop_codon:yes gene_type:complete
VGSDIEIHITDRNGLRHSVDAPIDMSMNLMELIRIYELAEEGSVGICGGMAMCASCQCYVESGHQLPEVSQDEKMMLLEAFNVQDDSRLACQIYVSTELDGLKIRLAPAE